MNIKYCTGCDDDIYNHGGIDGNTEHCWNLEDAELTNVQEVHIDQLPPYKQKPITKPDCYKKRQFAYIKVHIQ